MTVGIYAIYDVNTNECLYVGQSQNIEERFKKHVRLLKSKSHISKAFNDWFSKNGHNEKQMSLVIVERCSNDCLVKNELEIKWFNNLKPLFYGKKPSLNETWEHTESTKDKIRNGVLKFHEKQGTRAVFIQSCLNCNMKFERKRKHTFCSVKCSVRYEYEHLSEDAIDLYVNKMKSTTEVGQELGVSQQTAYNILKRNNVSFRGK